MGDVSGYWIVCLAFRRAVALVYLIAFISAVNQYVPLVGEHGLLPVRRIAKRVSFWDSPSLFLLFPNDRFFTAAAWTGVGLSCIALLGIAEYHLWSMVLTWAALWVLYLSF